MSDFVDIAGTFRAEIERELKKIFTPEGLLTETEIPEALAEPMRYALLAGGKRLRPVLCLTACTAICGTSDAALPAAVGIELLHNYTLVHDDLPCMDNDLLRRGNPTVHAKYGEGEAVLVGDALQAAAFACVSKSPVPAGQVLRMLQEFARAAGPAGVVGGQWKDVCREKGSAVTPELVEYVHLHKTGDLIRCALLMGAIAGGADDAQCAQFSVFGNALGVAFQLIDDILDAADAAKADELSVLRICSLEEAKRAAEEKTREALRALDALNERCPGEVQQHARQLLRELAASQLSRTL